MTLRIDAKKIVTRFAGRTELSRRLAARGHEVSVKTIGKWIERDSIPTARLLAIMDLAKSEGRPISIDDYVVSPKKLSR